MAVIEFNHVSKSYRLGAARGSLRGALSSIPKKIVGAKSEDDNSLFWALNDVSFNVEKGEVLGIIGHNGAGKSTTLKLLSKVTFPTSGHIVTRGRMSALIELGAGFHPDLSGRENVFLNGSILGLKRNEINQQFDKIVEFAGLERFIDTPVKRYSSGMYVRLAFAVAAHISPEIMLIDEVLSVGDENFQRKCFEYLNNLRNNGTTIVFISHNLWAVSNFCSRVLLFRQGKIEAEGTGSEVIESYRTQEREMLAARTLQTTNDNGEKSAGGAQITSLETYSKSGNKAEEFDATDEIMLKIKYKLPYTIKSPMFVIRIRRASGMIVCALPSPKGWVDEIKGEGEVEVCLGPTYLLPDFYSLQVLLSERISPHIHATSYTVQFRVRGVMDSEDGGVYEPQTKWTI